MKPLTGVLTASFAFQTTSCSVFRSLLKGDQEVDWVNTVLLDTFMWQCRSRLKRVKQANPAESVWRTERFGRRAKAWLVTGKKLVERRHDPLLLTFWGTVTNAAILPAEVLAMAATFARTDMDAGQDAWC